MCVILVTRSHIYTHTDTHHHRHALLAHTAAHNLTGSYDGAGPEMMYDSV